MSGESEGERQPVIARHYGEDWVDVNETLRKIQEDIRIGKQPANVPDPKSIAAQSSTP